MSASESVDFKVANIQRTFDSIRPLLVQACEPIAQSFKDIERQHGISVDMAELEVSFTISAEAGLTVASAKQNSSITVKLILKPDFSAYR